MFYTMLETTLVFVLALLSISKCSRSAESVGIVGGYPVPIQAAPFMASLRLNGTHHWCGGSVVHDRFVLTAAHCIVPNRKYKVLVGTESVERGGELYDVDAIIPHESYSNTTDDYDICLIKVNKSFAYGPKVAKIALADENTKIKKGTALDVTGWGYTKPNGTISNVLLQVSVPAVASRSCQRAYFSALRHITPRMMCAGGRGKDSCQGDSGGPLTLGGVQVGVASFGVGCGVLPGVYTKVAALQPWITQTIERNL